MLKLAVAVVAVVGLAGSASAAPVLSGRVVDAGGAPVPAAVVSVVKLDARYRAVAASGASLPLGSPLGSGAADESGAFSIDASGIEPGLHALAVSAPDRPAILRWHERVVFGAPALPTDLELRLPALATVTGLVVDETGAPLANMPLVGVSESESLVAQVTTTTDASGRFEMRALQDAALTVAGALGSRWGIVRAPIGAETRVVLAVHAAPLELLEGVAVSRVSGRPVAGVRIRALAPTWDPLTPTPSEQRLTPWGRAAVLGESVTGDDGRYSVRVPRGGLAFTTSPRSIAQRAQPGQTQLTDGPPMRGVVVDERGAPVKGADVRWSEISDAVLTDERGSFTLLPNVHAAVVATTDDGASSSVEVRNVTDAVRIVVPELSLVAGTVTEIAGAADVPAAGVTVRATTPAWDVLTATDSTGAFALRLRGIKRLTAQRGALAATAAPGSAVRLDLSAGRSRPASGSSPVTSTPAPTRIRVVDAAGKPIAGALARVPVEDPSIDTPTPTAGSDADGLVLLRVPGREARNIPVIRPGWATAWAPAVKPGSEVTVRLQAGALLRGVVRAPSGEAIGGAAVVAELEEDRSVAAASNDMSTPAAPTSRQGALADAAGVYELRDLPAGTHAIDVVAIDFASPPRQRIRLAAGERATLDLSLSSGATLRGIVRDGAGPVAGAEVRATPRAPTFTGEGFGVAGMFRGTYTLDDGTFSIPGLQPEQWYDVSVTATWHSTGRGGGRPAESVVEIALVATGGIAGTLEGDSERAAVHCQRIVPASEPGQFTSGYAEVVDGAFTVEPLTPGAYRCSVEAEVAAGEAERVDVAAGSATPVTIRLEDRPFVAIAVTAADTGLPIEQASISLASSHASSNAEGRARLVLPPPREPPPVEEQVNEEQAEFLLEMARRDRILDVRAQGYEGAEIPLPDPWPKTQAVKLQPLPRVRGRVVDPAGQPAFGAEVGWEDDEPAAVADADGRFDLADVEDFGVRRKRVLVARRVLDDWTEEGKVEFGDEVPAEVVISLVRVEPAQLTVIVRDAAGPVAGARIALFGPGATEGTTNAEGRFVAVRLDPGQYSLMVESEKGAMTMRPEIALAAGEQAVETVVLGEGWTVDGRVVAAGRPYEGAEIMWHADNGAFGPPTMSRADGSFQVGPISSDVDAVTLMVSVDQRSRTQQLTVKRGDPPLLVNVGVVTLRGRVVAGDEPVPEAMLRLRCPEGAGRGRASTDGGGLFSLDAPAERECALVITAADQPSTTIQVKTATEGLQDLGDVRIASRVIHGRAFAPEGHVIEHLDFVMMVKLGAASGTRTDAARVPVAPDGSFELVASTEPRRFLAIASDEELAQLVGELGDAPTLDLAFELGAILELSVTNADGTPAEASAEAIQSDGGAGEDASDAYASIEDGRGRFTQLRAGHVTVEIHGATGAATVEADVRPGETTRVSATLR